MEKFLSIPVLDAGGTLNQDQLVSISNIVTIGQTTTSAVAITYLDGKVVTLTWPSTYASPILEISVQNAVTRGLESGWTNVSSDYLPKGATVTQKTGIVSNPLSTIVYS